MTNRREGVRLRWRDQILLRMPAGWLEPLAVTLWTCRSLFNSGVRWDGRLRYEWGRDSECLTQGNVWRTMASGELETLIDRRMHLGRLSGLGGYCPELEATAQELADTVAAIRHDNPKRPIIISPFHYVSEYANIYVVDALRAKLNMAELAVVSGSPRQAYGNREDILIPGLRLLHTYDEEKRSALGLRLMRALRQEKIAVLFSDVPPYMMQRFPMETVEVSIQGRPARLHRGVFTIGSHADALLVNFYLTFSKGHFGHRIFPPVELAWENAPQQVANHIELAYHAAYPNWILADHPSRYGFSPTK